jgi:hypothetical protein
MLWIDIKYIGMLSYRLRNFKRKSQNLWNMSCPLCGDSKSRPRAARGYVYKKGDQLNYCCKKCGAGMSVKNFIAAIDPVLHKEMQFEYFKPAENIAPVIFQERPVFDKTMNPFKGLIKISDLPKNNLCRKYVTQRLIPIHLWDELYFTSAFYTWCGDVLPGRYEVPDDVRDDEPRLVIPMRNQSGELTAFQGRSLPNGKDPKYVFLALTKDEPLIWGLDRIDPNKKVYVLEGPIDAMFIPNAIACGGGDLSSNISRLNIPKENFVIVYDNEPRNEATIGKIQRAIERGFSVCIWPKMAENDVNKMVEKNIKYGLPAACQYVFARINEGIYSGPAAMMALTRWSRIKTNEVGKNERKSNKQ